MADDVSLDKDVDLEDDAEGFVDPTVSDVKELVKDVPEAPEKNVPMLDDKPAAAGVGQSDPTPESDVGTLELAVKDLNSSIQVLNMTLDKIKESGDRLAFISRDIPSMNTSLKKSVEDAVKFTDDFPDILAEKCKSQNEEFQAVCMKEYKKMIALAVKNFREFSKQASAWQKTVESKSNKKSSFLSYLIVFNFLLSLLLVVFVVFKLR